MSDFIFFFSHFIGNIFVKLFGQYRRNYRKLKHGNNIALGCWYFGVIMWPLFDLVIMILSFLVLAVLQKQLCLGSWYLLKSNHDDL